MRTINIRAAVGRRTAVEVFRDLAQFECWPRYSTAIRKVTVTDRGAGRQESAWEANFHDGILRWVELDVIDPEARRVSFEQLSGDVDLFRGTWALVDDISGCRFWFDATFDLGLPALADLLEPIAEQAIRENIHSVLRGLLGEAVTFEPTADTTAPASPDFRVER